MGYVTWSYDTLNTFCKDVFQSFGFSEQESEEIKDVLLKADLYGIESHGMQRMVRYHRYSERHDPSGGKTRSSIRNTDFRSNRWS